MLSSLKSLSFYCISILFILFFGIACNEAPPPINPNGDSELALLMRQMYDEGEIMKQKIMEGKKHKVPTAFQNILSAEATEPAKVNTQEYKNFADAYLSTLEKYTRTSGLEAKEAYHDMVESCISCHKSVCPGPVVKIKKLYLPKEK